MEIYGWRKNYQYTTGSMKIVTRYLIREVYTAILATMIVLLMVFLSNQFVRFMRFAASGMLSSNTIKTLLLLQLPLLAAILLPVSLFLGIILAYGRLYADSEMTVLTACGVGPGRLLATTLGFSLVIMMIVAALSLWINPKVYKYSDHIASGAASNSVEMVKAKSFNVIGNGRWVFYVEKISADHKHFYHVFASEQPEVSSSLGDAGLCIVTAKSAYQKTDAHTGELYMMLVNGYRYQGTPGQNDYEVIKYDEYGLKMPQSDTWQGDASSMPTAKLWQERQNNLAGAELQWRISLPLSALILTLLALPLSKIKPKQGRYARIFSAVLLYVIYANFLFLAKAWIKNGVLSPILGMWWVHGLMLILAGFLLGQQLRWGQFFTPKKSQLNYVA